MNDTPYNDEQLFEQMPIPRFIVRALQVKGKPDRYVVERVNVLALKYFDQERSEIEGHQILDFMGSDNALHFGQSFEVCLQKKAPVTIQALPGVPGQIKISSFIISPVLCDAGTVECIDVIGQVDVTDQSALQRERDDALLLLTSIFDVSEIGIVVTDYTGRIVRVNESFVRNYGWSRNELLHEDMISFVSPDEREAVRSNYEEFIKSGLRTSGELKLIRKEGTIANVLFTTATMELSQRRRFQVTTVMDISLRKKMEESLRKAKEDADSANHAKSTFLANMSHELRTPLNAILGFSEMMIKETFGALGHPKYKEYMEDVHGSAEHLLQIINEVLDMSKIEAERIELDEHRIRLVDLVNSVARMLASKAFSSGIEITVDLLDDAPDLWADERLIRQVLINLMTNAVKFSQPGGVVQVRSEILKGGALCLSIEDHGVGIPEGKIEQAMEPFGQVSEQAENAVHRQGTGLGLPLAKAMVELHGGRLSIESKENSGTTVFVELPAERLMAREDVSEKPVSQKDDNPLAAGGKDA